MTIGDIFRRCLTITKVKECGGSFLSSSAVSRDEAAGAAPGGFLEVDSSRDEGEELRVAKSRWILQTWPMMLLLFGLPFLLYAGSCNYGRILIDDYAYLSRSVFLRRDPVNTLRALWTAPYFSDYFPITQMTWWFDIAVFGDIRWTGARLHGLAWFGLGALAIRSLVERLTSRPRLALLVAVLYVLHPVCSESVLWLSQRKTLVSLALSYWSIERYLASRREADDATARRYRIVAIILFVLAMLAKIHAVMVCAVVGLYEVVLGHGSWRRRLPWAFGFATLAGTAILLNIVYVQSFAPRERLGGSALSELLTTGLILWRYIAHTLWPTSLALSYGIDIQNTSSAWGWGSWILLAGTVAGSIAASRQRRLLAFCWLLGAAALVPALNVVRQPLPMSDHYHQWALPAGLLILCLIVEEIVTRVNVRTSDRLLPIIAVGAAVFWLLLLEARIPYYRTSYDLLSRDTQLQPHSSLAWAYLAQTLAESSAPEDEMRAGAAARRSLRAPDNALVGPDRREPLILLSVMSLRLQGQQALAEKLLESESALLPPQMSRWTRARLAFLNGEYHRCTELLSPDFRGDISDFARVLGRACQSGDYLPTDQPRGVEIGGKRGDEFTSAESERRFEEALWLLGSSYLRLGDRERAFEVAVVTLNMYPHSERARALVTEVYALLGLPTSRLHAEGLK